jgi:hypothetical protein
MAIVPLLAVDAQSMTSASGVVPGGQSPAHA